MTLMYSKYSKINFSFLYPYRARFVTPSPYKLNICMQRKLDVQIRDLYAQQKLVSTAKLNKEICISLANKIQPRKICNLPLLAMLSGEIFKENFTDIFQTNLEQVAFSLESHKIGSKKSYKTKLWKELRLNTNRRFPCFTETKIVLTPCFSNRGTSALHNKYKSSIFTCTFKKIRKASNYLSLNTNLLPTFCFTCKASKTKRSKATKTSTSTNTSTGTNRRFVRFFVRNGKRTTYKFTQRFVRKLRTKDSADQSKDLFWDNSAFEKNSIKPKTVKIHTNQNFVILTKPLLLKNSCSDPVLAKKTFTQNSSTSYKPTICTSIKIGDYLSSGDKIGEKILRKKKYIKKEVGYFSYATNFGSNFTFWDEAMRVCTNSYKKSKICNTRRTNRQFVLVAKQLKLHFAEQNLVFRRRFVSLNRNQLSFACFSKICLLKKTEKKAFTRFAKPVVLDSSGRVITISKTQLILQKTQPVLFYNSANLHVKKGSWVKEGSPILTLTHQTLITGDIVQGIPRIEQLFEAFTSPPPDFKDKRAVTKFKNSHDTLHSQVRDIFRKHWLKSVLPIAVRKSLEEIQYILVEMIQKVYLSQGVLIADKHIEIIIRQIASKGQILDSGTTGLFLEEVLPIRQIENANLTTPGKKCLYVPAVMGLTAAALNSDSFISAASFQETTRVLSRDAVVGKSDFLRGLKEKVVIGDLISAGTGLDTYFIYTTMLAF